MTGIIFDSCIMSKLFTKTFAKVFYFILQQGFVICNQSRVARRESPKWLILTFGPKFWVGGGDLQILFSYCVTSGYVEGTLTGGVT